MCICSNPPACCCAGKSCARGSISKTAALRVVRSFPFSVLRFAGQPCLHSHLGADLLPSVVSTQLLSHLATTKLAKTLPSLQSERPPANPGDQFLLFLRKSFSYIYIPFSLSLSISL